MSYRHHFVVSDHPAVKTLRRIRRSATRFTLPAPRLLVRPILWIFLIVRALYFQAWRLLICEPIFKAYCTQYGHRVRTGVYAPRIGGKGDIILGSDVLIDGRFTVRFREGYVDRPLLTIGDSTFIGHNCTIGVGRRVSIGSHCLLSTDVVMCDGNEYPLDPAARLAGEQPPPEEMREIVIGDNVWIGRRAIIYPGVTIGDGSVVSAGTVVMADVPACTVVAGNPARRIASLQPPAAETPETRTHAVVIA